MGAPAAEAGAPGCSSSSPRPPVCSSVKLVLPRTAIFWRLIASAVGFSIVDAMRKIFPLALPPDFSLWP
eukprot:12413404-Heterocapsa_arctica.AAC.1